MITVKILINGKQIHRIHSVNVSEANGSTYGSGTQLYYVYNKNGEQIGNILHLYEEGSVELSKKMLEVYLLNGDLP